MANYRLYITIVEQGSFSKAAEKLGITQPTVSKQVDRPLEQLTREHRCVGTRIPQANPWIEKMLGDLPVQTWEWELTSNEGLCLVAQR